LIPKNSEHSKTPRKWDDENKVSIMSNSNSLTKRFRNR
jgi:hypothetical protein